MKQYLVTYMTSNTIVIEAESEDDAREKFWEPDNINYAVESLNENPVEITDVCEYDD